MTELTINRAFGQARRARHLTLNAVATESLSAAAISRFERGLTQLSSQQLLTLMERLGLSSHDVSVMRFDSHRSVTLQVSQAVANQIHQQQFALANQTVAAYTADALDRQKHPDQDRLPLPLAPVFGAALAVRVAGAAHQAQNQQQVASVVRHLRQATVWFDFEFEVLAYVAAALSPADALECITLGSDQVTKRPLYAPSFLYCLVNLLLASLENNRALPLAPVVAALKRLDLSNPHGFDPLTILAQRQLGVCLGEWAISQEPTCPEAVRQIRQVMGRYGNPNAGERIDRIIAQLTARFNRA